MRIERLELNNFRNFGSESAEFSEGVNIVEGLNAQGKTNMLEGVYYCATGRSFRGAVTKSLIKEGEKTARVSADIARGEKHLSKDRVEAYIDERGKAFYVDGMKAARLGDLFGRLYCVSFCPEDLKLAKAGPEMKRRFIDMELCQLDHIYYKELKAYYRALKHRNALLKSVSEDRDRQAELEPWDIQLAEFGERITAIRESYTKRLAQTAEAEHERIARERIKITYAPNCPSGTFTDRLKKSFSRDIYMGVTTRGAHKDDLHIAIDGRDARIFASQGQARSAAVSIKLAQMRMFQAENSENPVMLLDDVLSELDADRQKRLIDSIGGVQTIITCTGAEASIAVLARGAKRFFVEGGKIST